MRDLADYDISEFKDLLREIYRESGQRISEDPEVMTKVATYLGLRVSSHSENRCPSDGDPPDRF